MCQPQGKGETGFMHHSVHIHRERNRVASCITVFMFTWKGTEWLHCITQTHGEEDSGFKYQCVHTHRGRKRLASLHHSVHRHMVREIMALWREGKRVAL